MVFWIVLMVVVSLLLAAVYTRLSYIASPQTRVLSKVLASLSFVVLGRLCASYAGASAYGTLICLGLVFGLLGDGLLEMTECRPDKKELFFLSGLIGFLIGHLLYIPAFLTAVEVRFSRILLGLLFFAALYVLQFPMKLEMGKAKTPVCLYGLVVSLMAGCGISGAFIAFSARSFLMLLGSLLFLVSDTFLLLRLFSPKSKWWFHAAVLVTYYPAQILLALSVLAA